MRMQKFALRLILICGTAALLFAVLNSPGSRAISTPLTRQMSAMREIGRKLRDYAFDHSATEADVLKGKSIDDLVAMNILSAADAAYLGEHQVRFHGYDPSRIGGDVPLFEADYPRYHPRWRIVVYSDLSAVPHDWNDHK